MSDSKKTGQVSGRRRRADLLHDQRVSGEAVQACAGDDAERVAGADGSRLSGHNWAEGRSSYAIAALYGRELYDIEHAVI